ncbi:homoserine dehydrogenase [Leucobacter sp. BZR 635]
MASRVVRVALTGSGGIGSRVAVALLERRAHYLERFGCDVRLVGVCGSRSGVVRDGGLHEPDVVTRATWSPGVVGTAMLAAAEPDVVVDAGPNDYATGGPGLSHLEWAVERGSHAIMVSKSALALHGERLLAAARDSGSRVHASGASSAALPAVDFLRHNLAGAVVTRVEAALTGTTSLVLDSVTRLGMTLEEAIADAQARGIAEPEPAFDLDGWDTAAKLTVISGLALGTWLHLDSIPRESVGSVRASDIDRWRDAGEKPALVGVLERSGSGYVGRVEIQAYGSGHPFASAQGSTKALMVQAEGFGEYTLVGGASSPAATVASVLKDVEHLLREISG